MPEEMTHWERVRATLKGERPDRPPISAWRHFYGRETTAQGLADAMLTFQRRFDWDFMKVNPRASYHAEDWGLRLRFSGDDAKEHEVVDWPVKRAEDWQAIEPLDPHRGVLGEQLEALRIIAQGLDDEVPFLMTVFTPLSIAGRLAGSDDAMSTQLKAHPEAVHAALETITETFVAFTGECLEIGASGLFFATTTWGTYDRMTEEEYTEFGRPYDLRVLESARDAEFNVLHVCRSNNMLLEMKDYPVAAFNWDTQDDTNVWLNEGGKVMQKPVVGGVSHRTVLLEGTPEDVAAEAVWTAQAMEVPAWMLGTGCTFAPAVPEANLDALRNAFGPK